MGHQGPRHQVRIKVGAVDHLAESLLMYYSLYRHPEAVGLGVVSPYHTTGFSRHTNHLDHIGAHPSPAK